MISSSCVFFTTPSSLCFSPALTWGPTRRRQTSMDFWQYKSISLGKVLGKPGASVSVLREIVGVLSENFSSVGSLVHGATGCQEPAPAWALCELLLGPSMCSSGGGLPQAERISLHRSLENLPRFFFTDLSVCKVVPLTCYCSSLRLAVVVPALFPHPKCIIPEVLLWLLMDLALASSGYILELTGFSSVGHGGCFWHLLTDVTSVVPLYKTLSTHLEDLCALRS